MVVLLIVLLLLLMLVVVSNACHSIGKYSIEKIGRKCITCHIDNRFFVFILIVMKKVTMKLGGENEILV